MSGRAEFLLDKAIASERVSRDESRPLQERVDAMKASHLFFDAAAEAEQR